ncbi:MAG: hypothetical protein A3F72_10055 [Bacteroidetes bacterium RIFCSPLOWO2_12_FULL_35_15]|nr:MAG: hypothetical protein A3F72_10055 [Bacteroidetes bacterium RIFCSPLOWO2_12_FULL_35_15]
MLKKDYIEKQLEQLALAIAKVISQITNSKMQGNPDSGIIIADEFLRSEFDVELAKLAAMDKEHLIEYLTTHKNLKSAKLNLMANLLFETAELYERSQKENIAKNLYERTLIIYDYVNETEKTFSQHRQEKIRTIKLKI